jgi:hypothetical protein
MLSSMMYFFKKTQNARGPRSAQARHPPIKSQSTCARCRVQTLARQSADQVASSLAKKAGPIR